MKKARIAAALAATLLMATGCVPQVLHGPRVETGKTGVLQLSAARSLPISETEDWSDDRFVIGLYGGGRIGSVSADGRTAYSLGAQVPLSGVLLVLLSPPDEALEVLGATSYVDAYLQPNRLPTGMTDYGVGVLVSTALVTPYAQYGRTLGPGASWYTTQAFAYNYRANSGNALLWLPSISRRSADDGRGRAVSYTAGGTVGRISDRTHWGLILAVTAEIGPKK